VALASLVASGAARAGEGEQPAALSARGKPAAIRPAPELFASCARCHTIGKGSLVGPDLLDVHKRHDADWLIAFIRGVPSKEGGATGHAAFTADQACTAEEARALIDYVIDESNKIEADPNFLNNGVSAAPKDLSGLLVAASFALALAMLDLVFFKFSSARWLNVAVIVASLGAIGAVAASDLFNVGRRVGYEPDQPIRFSHRVHAGENKIACTYCHTGVQESRYASIPPATVCLNCHGVIRKGTNTGDAEIDKIHEAVTSKTPIQWVKVYKLPDHVFFSHAQHVTVAKLACKTCHGEVEKMGRVQQVVDLSMGWCVNCHRDTQVDFDNKYYASYKLHDDLSSGAITAVTAQDVGANNCQKCHY
jgi:mono/diheme cytochrome c family protein